MTTNLNDVYGILVSGKRYIVSGYVKTKKNVRFEIKNGNTPIFSCCTHDSEDFMYFQVLFTASDNYLNLNAEINKDEYGYAELDGLSIVKEYIPEESEEKDIQEATKHVQETIDFTEDVSFGPLKAYDLGDDWLRLSSREEPNKELNNNIEFNSGEHFEAQKPEYIKKDPHEGMVYNKYTDKWSWF